jgi:3-oxoacyl-(acyl-carrier-protein) reductase
MATETQTKQDPIGIRLDGRVALVTGGNRGIGAAICRSMASQGAAIAAGYSSNRERAEHFLDELKSEGATATIHQGNVGHAEDCERVVEEVIDQHGRLDILVNNAGITADKPIWKMSVDDWHKVININLSGAFHMSKPALEHMMARGCGRIINITSIVGQTGNIGQANYAASKSGLFGLTTTLAKEAAFALERGEKLDPEGVGLTVNAVAPGFIETDMTAAVPEKALDRVREQIPVKRLGRAEEIARVVHFLASDASSYITGQVWAVNGGMDM